MVASSHFDDVIQGLAQDQNSVRIKKLLIYTCKNVWESNPDRLNFFNVSDLIQELLGVAPTLEQLKICLSKAVQTLNKPAEYALIANSAIHHLKNLYIEYQESTQIVSNVNIYSEVAHQLEHDPDQIRIKKLLFFTCNNVWENDLTQLHPISVASLVRHLHELTPTFNHLKAVLDSIVATLNRQAEYRLIASKIISAFEPLYHSCPEVEEHTQVLTVPVHLPSPPNHPPTPSLVQPSISDVQAVVPTSPAASPTRSIDPFDLRMEIIKYTNPLRAKILIFSGLYYPIDSIGEAWSVIRSQELDDLLFTLLQDCQTFTTLETKLRRSAETLQEPDQYLQAASAILRAVKPLYDGLPPDTNPAQWLHHASPKRGTSNPRSPTVESYIGSDRRLVFPVSPVAWEFDSHEDHTGPLAPPSDANPAEIER